MQRISYLDLAEFINCHASTELILRNTSTMFLLIHKYEQLSRRNMSNQFTKMVIEFSKMMSRTRRVKEKYSIIIFFDKPFITGKSNIGVE